MIFFQPKRLMGESLCAIVGEANTATLPRRACRENNPAISGSREAPARIAAKV
jgi:hypothetical protein